MFWSVLLGISAMEMEFQLSGVSHREESLGGLCGGCLILIRGDSLATTSDAAFFSKLQYFTIIIWFLYRMFFLEICGGVE